MNKQPGEVLRPAIGPLLRRAGLGTDSEHYPATQSLPLSLRAGTKIGSRNQNIVEGTTLSFASWTKDTCVG